MGFNSADIEISCASVLQFPESDRAEVAFVGRSNVGKSSLINRVIGRKSLARVSAMPGKTATINFYLVDKFRFVDLPGYGYAKVAKNKKSSWKKLIFDYLVMDRDMRLVVQLIDARHPPSNLDNEMTDFLIDNEIPFVVVFTKSDKLSKKELENSISVFSKTIPCYDDIFTLAVSSEKGTGIEELEKILVDVLSDCSECCEDDE